METVLKSFISPIVVGILMFVFGAWYNSSSSEVVEARLETIDFWADPRPLYGKEVRDLLLRLETETKIGGLLKALDDAKVRMVFQELTLSNNTQQRSKEILVSAYKPWFAWMYRSGPGPFAIARLPIAESSDFTLPSINPGDTVKIYLISDYVSLGSDLRVLHDGRKINLSSLRFDPRSDHLGIIEKGLRYPFTVGGLAVVGMLSLIWMVLGVIYKGIIYFNPHFRAKVTTEEVIADWVNFLKFLREHYPEKMPHPKSESAVKL